MSTPDASPPYDYDDQSSPTDIKAASKHHTQDGETYEDEDVEIGDNDPLLQGANFTTASNPRSVENDVFTEEAIYGQNVTWTSAYILIISRMIGAGIFATPGVVVQSAGSIGLSMCVWILGALVTAIGVVVNLEYGCMLPRSGGDKIYLEYTYRRPRFLISTIIAASAVLQASTANACIVFGEYFVYGLPIQPTAFARKSSAIGMLLAVAVMHSFFLKSGIFVQNILGWVKISMMLTMALTAIVVIVFGSGSQGDGTSQTLHTDKQPGWDAIWEGSNWGWEMMSLAFFKVNYAYSGIDNANNVLNEVKDPARMLKRVVPLSLITVCVLYMLVNAAFLLVIPLDELKRSGEMAAVLFFTRLFGKEIGGHILPLFIAVSVAGSVAVGVFSLSRLNQEIARQGFLPLLFASSHPRNAPLGGVIVIFVPTALLIFFLPSTDIFSFLLAVDGYSSQLFAIALACGLLWLRRIRPELHRPFKAWRSVVVVRILICIALIVAPFIPFQGKSKKYLGLWHGTYALVGIAM
ncbi:Amino acid/polyamine transporter I [Lasallia pustulata]|uniref:Amino acid/polyamine transporter I n=1 Tax=Lasallia pustulata TaxID=136370 RepID=A0A1W5CZU2_9LECA|nr:Amino acid/polyamine transporter I [Lasallia pustulata]